MRNGVRMLKISRKQLTERARHTLARASRNSHAQSTRRHKIARSMHPRLRGTRSPKLFWPRGAEDPEFAYKRPVSAEFFWLLKLDFSAAVLDQNHTHTHIKPTSCHRWCSETLGNVRDTLEFGETSRLREGKTLRVCFY